MSLFEKIFGAKAAPATSTAAGVQAPAQPAPTNNLQTNPAPAGTASSAGTAPNGVIPEGSKEPPAPMEKFKDLWTPPAPAKDGENQGGNAPIDPQKLMEAASRVDFSKVVDQESLAKIAAGGEEAAAALVNLLNRTAQQVYGQSTVVTAKLVEQAVSQAREDFIGQIPDVIRKQNARASVFDSNPAFANPAIAPMIEAQVQQFALKYPKATPAELNGMAKEYLTDMANLLNPPKSAASANKQTANGGDDWSEYS